MTTRKSFIGGMLAAGAVPTIVPHSVFGKNAPSNRITVGGIGVGGIGNAQLPQMKSAGFEVVALCDLDWQYAERVFKKFPQARKYKDYEEMLRLEGDKIDAVYCGCPDHWHTLVCLAAIAIITRCCCPPESSHGNLRIVTRGSPTDSRSDATRSSSALPVGAAAFLEARRPSAICLPTRITGLSDCIGFWKM